LRHARETGPEFDPPTHWEIICGQFGIQHQNFFKKSVEEILTWDLWRGVFGEFFASGIFVFILNSIIVASGLLELPYPNGPNRDTGSLDPSPTGRMSVARYLSISVGAGFAFALANYTFFPASGGHITPAISWSLLWTHQISFLRWLVYLCAQLLGAIIGTGFAKTVNYGVFDAAGGGINIVHTDLGYDDGVSVGIDTLTTTILCLTALSFYDRRRPKTNNWFGHLALGFVFLTVHLLALPINGASMNPARSFASSAVYHQWHAQWTWWLGPGLGATIAAIWYELFIREKDVKGLRSYQRL